MSLRQQRVLGATALSLILIGALTVPVYLGVFGFAAPERAIAQDEGDSEFDTTDVLAAMRDYPPPLKPMPGSYMCGPDALCQILRKWGGSATPDELAGLAGTTAQDGTSLAGLRDAAQARGALASGVALDYTALQYQVNDQNVAVIAHVKPAHYYWVRHVMDSGVALQDQSSPAAKWMARAEFEQIWTGNALLVLRPVRSLSRGQ